MTKNSSSIYKHCHQKIYGLSSFFYPAKISSVGFYFNCLKWPIWLLPSRPTHGEVTMDPLHLSLMTRITPASPRRVSPPPSQPINRTPSTASRQHQATSKSSPSKKKQRNFKRNLTSMRWSPTLVSNASSTASKNSILKNSTKSFSGLPTTLSKVFSTISEPTGAMP